MREMYEGVLVGKPEATRPLERPRCRWQGNTDIISKK
jgi:hypothetical protein